MFYFDLLGLVENIRQLKKDISTLNNRLNELSYVDYEAELNDKRNYPSNNFGSIQVNSANNIDFILINEILYCKAKKITLKLPHAITEMFYLLVQLSILKVI